MSFVLNDASTQQLSFLDFYNNLTERERITRTKSGEKATVEYILDESKIAEEEKYDGYYAVATNLLDPAKDILAVSHKRYKIEDCFRIMKTIFSGRPVNHRLPNRIKAHFMICYTALLVYRLLEAKLTTLNLDRLYYKPKELNEKVKKNLG